MLTECPFIVLTLCQHKVKFKKFLCLEIVFLTVLLIVQYHLCEGIEWNRLERNVVKGWSSA